MMTATLTTTIMALVKVKSCSCFGDGWPGRGFRRVRVPKRRDVVAARSDRTRERSRKILRGIDPACFPWKSRLSDFREFYPSNQNINP